MALAETSRLETTVNIGLTTEQREAVIAMLNRILADQHILYIKTRAYHWNVVGMQFQPLHEFFEGQYDQIEEAIDETAERVRQLGGYALGSLREFIEHARLSETPGETPTAQVMLRNLLDDHEAVIRQLRADVDVAAEYHDMGTSDYLTGLLEAHEKMAWMLRAFLTEPK